MRWSAPCRSELNDRLSLQYSRQLAESIVPAPPADAREARPAKGGPIVDLKITMLELPISAELREQLGRLPFKPPTPGNEFARTMKVPVHNPKQGQTMPTGDDSIEKAVTALPFAGNKVSAGLCRCLGCRLKSMRRCARSLRCGRSGRARFCAGIG